ncbi:MAG: hypothetical protein VX899_24910 [Myxococcota bacterium]|nr:hypothetical protein [Myxococcota bacterium]
MTLLLALTACFSQKEAFPLRTTLEDGQVVVGAIQTPTLELEGGLGTLRIPLEDVGEIAPVEGGDLAGSSGHVTVWLRNGSELRGKWSSPELALNIEVGGERVGVELPTQELMRVQTQGPQAWPEHEVVRVQTTHGDDFLVDPRTTRIRIDSTLGTFAPFLTECASMTPISGDPTGDWRIELDSGTVLQGPLADDSMTLALSMGPEQVVVPLEVLQSIERQDWAVDYGLRSMGYIEDMPAEEAIQQDFAPVSSGPWFSNEVQKQRKLMY